MGSGASESAIIDGEGVYCREDGVSDFSKLIERVHDHHVCAYAFDLLMVDGEDWRKRPLAERKARLARLLRGTLRKRELINRQKPNGIRLSEHMEGDGATIFEHACKLGIEGIVSKRLDSSYKSGRAKTWVKVKNKKAPAYLRVREGGWS